MKRFLLMMLGLLSLSVGAYAANSHTATGSTSAYSDTAPVNINSADAKQLASLKGIGEKKANAIVADRQRVGLFHSVDDLTRVKGIGKLFLQRLIKNNPGRISVKNGAEN